MRKASYVFLIENYFMKPHEITQKSVGAGVGVAQK